MTKGSSTAKRESKKISNDVNSKSVKYGQAKVKVKELKKPPPSPPEICYECEGTGVIKCCDRCEGTGSTDVDMGGCGYIGYPCEDCNGEPTKEECASCSGSGLDLPQQKKKKEKERECYRRNGEGTVPSCRKCDDSGKYSFNFHGLTGYAIDCDECRGGSEEDNQREPNICERCDGSGKIEC